MKNETRNGRRTAAVGKLKRKVVGSGILLALFSMDIVTTAKQVASRAHSGQHRRDGVTPYINHPAAVAGKLNGESAVVIATAWLHDVLEDTAETPETLRSAGLPDSVIHAVEVLTKTEGVSYAEYLNGVRQNWIARKVKVADMLHNLSDQPTERQIIKYAKGLLALCANGADDARSGRQPHSE